MVRCTVLWKRAPGPYLEAASRSIACGGTAVLMIGTRRSSASSTLSVTGRSAAKI